MSCDMFWAQKFTEIRVLSFTYVDLPVESLADWIVERSRLDALKDHFSTAFGRYLWSEISAGQMAPQLMAVGGFELVIFLGGNSLAELSGLQELLSKALPGDLTRAKTEDLRRPTGVKLLGEDQIDFAGSTYVLQTSLSNLEGASSDMSGESSWFFTDDVYTLDAELDSVGAAVQACYLMPGRKLMKDINERVRDKEVINIDMGAKLRC